MKRTATFYIVTLALIGIGFFTVLHLGGHTASAPGHGGAAA